MSESLGKVVVGMSGGVDSSVAALLLKQQGYQVIGVMLKLWSEEGFGRDNQCCSLESAQQARIIASKIGIPFYLLDASNQFYNSVVKPFVDSYLCGQTPNPCSLCNPLVRWKMLLDYADAIDAQFVSTGHYARTSIDPDKRVHLFRGVDSQKDQSYIISRLNQIQLQRSIFPLGIYTKLEIRKIAAEYELPSASKPDSQDICFIGDGDYRNFLKRNYGSLIQSGNIVDQQHNILGIHPGLPFFTIGQRKGLKISAPEPYYVLSKNPEKNEVLVGKKNDLLINQVLINDVNWVSCMPIHKPIHAYAQFRYKAVPKLVSAEIQPDNRLKIGLEVAANDIACGQIAVLYNEDNEVIVSGRIIQTENQL
jgi:tRNA-specific 2-thiouridylase